MSRSINVESKNHMEVIGKVISVTSREGTNKKGKPYASATVLVGVNQMVNGHEEYSEVPVEFFSNMYKNDGNPNAMYDNVKKLGNLKSAQTYGMDNADTVAIKVAGTSNGALTENYYAGRDGRVRYGWRLNGKFCNIVKGGVNKATFTNEIYIMSMRDEIDSNGDTTGRLLIKGALVGYGGKLNVIDYIVENPEAVDYIQRNFSENTVGLFAGKIRITSKEVTQSVTGTWGEVIEDTSTRFVRELVIVSGGDSPLDEDSSYDPADIRKMFNIRKMEIEQLETNAQKPAAPAKSKYGWED